MSSAILVVTKSQWKQVVTGCIVLTSLKPSWSLHEGTYEKDHEGINYPGTVSRYWNRHPEEYAATKLMPYVSG